MTAPAEMRALSLTQPWASLVAHGEKTWETRSWSTKHRGPIAIHASAGFPVAAQQLVHEEPFADALNSHGYCLAEDLPRGAIVAVATLVAILPTRACGGLSSNREWAFGDFSPGRWAWLLAWAKPLSAPIPCKGALGLWTVPPEIAARVRADASRSGTP